MHHLGGAVYWEVLHWGDETLGDQLTVGGRSLPLNKFCLHASHLSLKSSTTDGGTEQTHSRSEAGDTSVERKLELVVERKHLSQSSINNRVSDGVFEVLCYSKFAAGGLVSSPVLSAPE